MLILVFQVSTSGSQPNFQRNPIKSGKDLMESTVRLFVLGKIEENLLVDKRVRGHSSVVERSLRMR